MNGQELNDLATQYLGEKNYDQARKYYLLAADEGNYLAMYNLACMYYFGDGVEKDDAKAFQWYRKATENGDMEAANRVGIMYQQGIGTDRDDRQAFAFFLRSAEGDSLSGQANLGFCYLLGKGTEKDVEKGLYWMNRASEGGNGIASVELGNDCREGIYQPRNYAEAQRYYRRGMEQRYAPAYLCLAEMYELGLGVDPDPAYASELRKQAESVPDED